MTLKLDFEAAADRCAKASQEPWLQPLPEEPRAIVSAESPLTSLLAIDRDGMAIFATEADATFTVAARADLPASLAALGRLAGFLRGMAGRGLSDAEVVEALNMPSYVAENATLVRFHDGPTPASHRLSRDAARALLRHLIALESPGNGRVAYYFDVTAGRHVRVALDDKRVGPRRRPTSTCSSGC